MFKSDKKPELLKETIAHLRLLFHDDIKKLKNILGKDYSKWIR
tara:strand:+ start:155 stop:283 length:129 start_codon:yes stop_codon:yes gene_type:complete